MKTHFKNHKIKYTVLVILTITFLLYCPLAESSELKPSQKSSEQSLVLGGWSHHFISKDITNESHRLVGYRNNDVMVAYFRNSYDEDSFFAGYSFFRDNKTKLDFELIGGIVRGYDKCFGKFTTEEGIAGKKKVIACPIVVPSVTINLDSNVKPQFLLMGDALVFTFHLDL